jgi:hypothetical protein
MSELGKILNAARPVVEQWLDVAAQFAALREAAAEQGLDWSRIKASLKAEIESEHGTRRRDAKDVARRSRARASHRGAVMP